MITKESFLFSLLSFAILSLIIGYFFISYHKKEILDYYKQSVDEMRTIEKEEEDSLLIRIFSKKNKQGEYIWLIILGCLFFLYGLIRLFFYNFY